MALSNSETRDAIRYNWRRHYDVELIRRIQRTVGVLDDGLWGPVTVGAVADWQAQQGLDSDGKVGPNTLAAFEHHWSGVGEGLLSDAEITAAIGYNRSRGYGAAQIRKIQATVGVPETGDFGRDTVLAVAHWQASEGLMVDGMVGPDTLQRLQQHWDGSTEEGHKEYRIHPGIGIARLGNSSSASFVGPEAPGSPPPGSMRDALGFVKRQAARFRIYEYSYDAAGTLTGVREIEATDATITWTVRLSNRKAAAPNFPPSRGGRRNAGVDDPSRLIIDSGERTLDAPGQSEVLNGTFLGASVRLGDATVDDQGRLSILGGRGDSHSPTGRALTGTFNNDEWYDDTSDGPVAATVKFDGADPIEAEGAWVVVAPPSYAPGLYSMVTWYDRALHVATLLDSSLTVSTPSFTRHIWPILRRTVLLHWVSPRVRLGHGPGSDGDFTKSPLLAKLASASTSSRSERQGVYGRLRLPGDGGSNMPSLNPGVDPDDPTRMRGAMLTPTQLQWMERWAQGSFVEDWPGSPPTPPRFDELPGAEQPAALDQAGLDSCLGGPFYPGIEACYRMERVETYRAPFRVARHHPPGFLTELLALPWQADFSACGRNWWPASRPVSVYRGSSTTPVDWWTSTGTAMVEDWYRLGFVRESSGRFVETERTLDSEP